MKIRVRHAVLSMVMLFALVSFGAAADDRVRHDREGAPSDWSESRERPGNRPDGPRPWLPVPHVGSFTLEPSTRMVTVSPGQTTTVTVRVIPSGGFSDPVTISSPSGFAGGTLTISPTVVGPPYDQLVTFTITTTAETSPGLRYVEILGEGGGVTVPEYFYVDVVQPGAGTFEIILNPSAVDVVQGSSSRMVVFTSKSGDFNSPIEYTISGLPAGITVTGLPRTVQPPDYTSFSVDFVAAPSVAPGTYTATITGTGGGKTVTKNVTVRVAAPAVGNYTVSVSPNPIVFPAHPARQTFSFTITSTGGFAGEVTVSMSSSGQVVPLNKDCPEGTFCPFTTKTYTIPAGGSITDQAIASSTGPNGGTIFIVTRTPGLDEKHTPVPVYVGSAPPDFAINAEPPSITVAQGAAANVTLTITRSGGFTDAVTVTTSTSPGIQVTSPITFAAGETSKTVEVRVSGTAPLEPGYVIFAAPAPGGGTRSDSVQVFVTQGPQQDFTISVAPAAVTIPQGGNADVTLTVTRTGGYTGTITASAFTSAGMQVTSPVTFAPGETTKTVTIGVDQTAPLGAGHVTFVATGTDLAVSRSARVDVTVVQGAPPDFTVALDPAAITLTQGASGTTTFTVTRTNGFAGPVNVTIAAPAGVTVSPASFTLAAGETSRVVTVTVASNVPPGPTPLTFTAVAPDINRTLTTTLQLTVSQAAQPANFTITATPATTTIVAGETRTITLTLTRQNFSGVVNVTAVATPAGISVPPVTFGPNETTRDVVVTADATTPAGSASIVFTATAPDIPGQSRTASVALTVLPGEPVSGAPIITSITPPGAVAGTQSLRLILTGENFAFGAQAVSSNAAIRIESTDVQLNTVATVVVSVDPFAPAGRYRINLTNPNGATTAQGIDFLVYEEGDIGAPLGVTSAAIISPMAGKTVSMLERPSAVGIVATTGSGTISGRWLLDGGTFDQFTITVSAGEPTIVTSRVPIPTSWAGIHRLQMVIDAPQYAQSAAINLTMSVETRTNLTILGPTAVAGESTSADEPLTLRWSMVPGALGYEVELEKNGERFGQRIAAGQDAELRLDWNQLASDPADRTLAAVTYTDTMPTDAQLSEIQRSTFRWRVAPIYCCSGEGFYPGAHSEWAPLRVDMMLAQRQAVRRWVQDAAIAAAVPASFGRHPRGERGGPSADAQEEAPARRSTPPVPVPPPSLVSRVRKDWSVLPMLTTGYNFSDEAEQGTFQVSGQGDVGLAPFSSKYTTDFTGSDIFGDDFTFAGSRNWIVNVGNASRSTRAIRPEALIGYAPPAFFSGTQLVTSSLARGGALVRAVSRFGTLSYYSTFTDELDGLMSGNFGMNQKVDAAAFELPTHKRFTFKILSLRVEDLPTASQYAPPGEGSSIGFLGTYNVSPKLQITAEGARGDAEWRTRNGVRERAGDAFRIGLNGYLGRRMYRFDLSRTDADFVNPANRGFSTAAIPNRTIGSFTLSNPIGRGSASLTLRHQLQTTSATDSTASGLNLSYNAPLGTRVMLSATGNYNVDRADANRINGLPGTDRAQLGTTITLSERFGRLNLSQTLSHQQLRDDINATATNDTDSITLTGGGAVGSNIQLHASTSIMRMSGFSDNDSVTVSLTPSFTIPSTHVSIAPQISYNYSRSQTGRSENTSRGERFATILQWNPQWLSRIAALQLSANWNRNQNETPFQETGSIGRSYVGTFTLKWGAGIGPATFRRDRAGDVPVTTTPAASQNPVNGRTPGR